MKSGKQFLGQDFKGTMQNRQQLSLLAFVIQHGKPLTEAAESEKMVKFQEKATAILDVANVQRHKSVFEPIQPLYLLSTTGMQEIADNEGAFLGTRYDACHQEKQAAFPLLRGMRNQSQLTDVVINVTNRSMRPGPMNEADAWDADGELYCTVFAAVDIVGRPLIVRTVARP